MQYADADMLICLNKTNVLNADMVSICIGLQTFARAHSRTGYVRKGIETGQNQLILII